MGGVQSSVCIWHLVTLSPGVRQCILWLSNSLGGVQSSICLTHLGSLPPGVRRFILWLSNSIRLGVTLLSTLLRIQLHSSAFTSTITRPSSLLSLYLSVVLFCYVLFLSVVLFLYVVLFLFLFPFLFLFLFLSLFLFVLSLFVSGGVGRLTGPSTRRRGLGPPERV